MKEPLETAPHKLGLTIPVSVHCDDGDHGVLVRCEGPVTGKNLVEANEALASCSRHRYQLWDFSSAAFVDAPSEAIHQLAIQDSSIPRTSQLEVVVIVGTHSTVIDLVQTYDLFSTAWVGRHRDYRTKVFLVLSEAKAWLCA